METIIVYSLTLTRRKEEYVFEDIDQLFEMAKELSRPNTTMVISTYRMSKEEYENWD